MVHTINRAMRTIIQALSIQNDVLFYLTGQHLNDFNYFLVYRSHSLIK